MRCKHCSVSFKPIYFLQKYCSVECKRYEPTKTKAKSKIRVRKTDIKKSHYIARLQGLLNKLARLIDDGLPCLATKRFEKMHGGHVFTRASYPNIKFNLHNIHRQCSSSNMSQRDDTKLKTGLQKEYGKKYLDFLNEIKKDKVKNSLIEIKIAISCVEELLITYKVKVNNSTERIEMRNFFNLQIKLYPEKHCIFKN
jgi:predicted nucleic acid-binding Zn ribbon protein